MMLRFLHWVTRFLVCRKICNEYGLYLERYRVFGWLPGESWKLPSLYLHRFHQEDVDKALHNHPWRWAVSLILAGGYVEERSKARTVFPIRRILRGGSLNIIGPDDYHRVAHLTGAETWTLFLVAPKSRSWGFLVPGRGHVEWKARLLERGIQP